MKHDLVYLGGPMDGLTFEEMNGWRVNVAELLQPLYTLSPTRPTQDGLRTYGPEGEGAAPYPVRFNRDWQDVNASGILLFNFIGAKKRSVGSTAEIGWGYALHRTIVVAMDDNNPNRDPFLEHQMSFRGKTLKDAVNFVRRLGGLPEYTVDGD